MLVGAGLAVLAILAVLLPAYIVYGQPGRSSFSRTQQALLSETAALTERIGELLSPCIDRDIPCSRALERLGTIPPLAGNSVRLLPRGEKAFDSIFAAIDSARDFVLVQFYIFRDDQLGHEMQQRLLAAAARGARVYLMFDRFESRVSETFLSPLAAAGVEVAQFRPERGWGRLHWKGFRNHRKMVVVDGEVVIMGGINVGDEYVDRVAKRAPWIDTQVEVRGPAVLAAQLAFVRDFHCATRHTLELPWPIPEALPGGCTVAMLATDPNPRLDSCTLMFATAMAAAQERIWLATPYFIPDEKGLSALELARLRGVEVRVLLPGSSDIYPTEHLAWHFIERLEPLGVRFFLQTSGSMHQKVLLIDDHTSLVGSANFDHRSFRLNLELTAWTYGKQEAAAVEDMLIQDFAGCREVNHEDVLKRSPIARLMTTLTRILTPVM